MSASFSTLPFLVARRHLLRNVALAFLAALAGLFPSAVFAEPLSKKLDIDFFRDAPSRNLRGLATRSDGRLVAGPVLTELAGPAPADLLWSFAPVSETQWLIGTGPDGRVFEADLDYAANSYATRELAKLDEPHVFTLRRLADGAILAGTSPNGGLVLLREGKIVARVGLPADSIFDLLVLSPDSVLVATGNPARIYRLDPTVFAASGVTPGKLTDAKLLAEKGLELFGEIRDRNVRRLARYADGRVIAGSSPKGNIYVFPAPVTTAGPAVNPVPPAAPVLLQENREAEVTDLLPQPNGDLYATLVFASSGGESRINLVPAKPKESSGSASATLSAFAPPAERFSGRSTLVYFPAGGFPEILASRANLAFYQLARTGDTLLIAGGELGELLGYDLKARFPLTFAGSTSAQLNALAAVPGAPGRFLVLRNNAAGLAVLDFNVVGERSAETRRLDLGTPARFGALRFDHLRNLAPAQLAIEIKTSFGSDEVEGWSPWAPLTAPDAADPAWRASDLRGRFAKLRVRLPASAAGLEIDKPALYFLPQNRRPVLQEFRFLAPNRGLIPGVEPAPSITTTIGSIINSGKDDDAAGPKRTRSAFLASQVVPSPGTQIALWTVADPDGDGVVATFSLRREGDAAWTDLAVASRESYVSFETSGLADGVYLTRLVAAETGPRPDGERLSVTFETDRLVVDHTPPAILEVVANRDAGFLRLTVRGRDALSLLEAVELNLNNGVRDSLEQTADGIRDAREETFVLEIPLPRAAGATSAEVTLYDAAGNFSSRRIDL